ncbi:MAG: peroxide stress protein YaaA [Granulosicoccus sp.]|nr:peroxide stress protein YaaA [Granulosicoccus sp.]
MLIVISPAKTLDFETPPKTSKFTQPAHLDRSQTLIDTLKKKSPGNLQKLMDISPALSELNHERYHQWQTPFDPGNAKQAVLAFKGDVYTGLEAENLSSKDLAWAQNHLRILSGLYGVLRPLDLMQPYRLEMGTALKTRRGKNLYEFWRSEITEDIQTQLNAIKSNTLVNLASNEYFKSVKPRELDAQVITPAFKDWKNGDYKMISFFAKKARGQMSAWIIKNRVNDVESLANFDEDGYRFDAKQSTLDKPVFLRKQ